MSNSAANTSHTEADQNVGAISQLQVELRCQLADVERRGAIWHYEEICNVLSTYVGGEGAAILLAGEQSAPSATTSSGQEPQQQPERWVRHGSPFLFPFPCNVFLAPDL
jgi:hypothetical protein